MNLCQWCSSSCSLLLCFWLSGSQKCILVRHLRNHRCRVWGSRYCDCWSHNNLTGLTIDRIGSRPQKLDYLQSGYVDFIHGKNCTLVTNYLQILFYTTHSRVFTLCGYKWGCDCCWSPKSQVINNQLSVHFQLPLATLRKGFSAMLS